MRVLVINLDRAPERLAHVTRTFGEAGVPFERVAATDGKKLGPEEIARWRQGTPHFGEMRESELACYLSHRRCWEMVAAGDEPAVIMEDDLYLGRGARDALARSDWLPADADIVKLETGVRPITMDRAAAGTLPDRKIHRVRGLNTGGGAYVLTPKCARMLLENIKAISDPFDHILFNPRLPFFERLAVYQVVPALCIQDSVLHTDGPGTTFRSYIAPERPAHQREGLAEFSRMISRPVEDFVRNVKQAAQPCQGPALGHGGIHLTQRRAAWLHQRNSRSTCSLGKAASDNSDVGRKAIPAFPVIAHSR